MLVNMIMINPRDSMKQKLGPPTLERDII